VRETYNSVSIAVSTFVGKILSLGSNQDVIQQVFKFMAFIFTLRLLMSYIYGAPSKARNANVIYIWT